MLYTFSEFCFPGAKILQSLFLCVVICFACFAHVPPTCSISIAVLHCVVPSILTIVLFRTVVQRARAEAMGVGLKHSTNNRPYVNC